MNHLIIGISTALLAALAANNQPAQSYATVAPAGTLKSLIHQHESGGRGYNSYNRGSMRCAKSNRAPIAITGMTIGQIQYYQSLPACSSQKLLAVGHYQIVPATLNAAVAELGLSKNTPFNQTTQDKIFALYLAKEKQRAIRRYVTTGRNINLAVWAVAREWAAFKAPTGRGVYDKVGNNHAVVPHTKTVAALKKAHQEYQQLLAAGLDPDTAYATALGAKNKKGNA